MGLFGSHQNIVTRADKISEFTVNTAEYGACVPEVLGTTRLSGNVIYYDDFTAHEHREVTESGKGGGSTQTNITYTYTVAVIFGLCEGEIAGIGKVWRGKEVYVYPNSNIQLTAFLGTQDQQPWAYVVGKHPEKAMSYAGLAYMAGVVYMGNGASLPQFNFEVHGKLLNTGRGGDVNPADFIRYVLDKGGMSSVPIEGLDNYRTFCDEADLLISSPPDGNPKQTQAIINDICKLTNAYFFWSNDKFKIVPVETRPFGTWTPDTTIRYNLTADDFLPQSNGAMVTYSRKDSSEIYNSFPVEFINRANAYEKETVNYQLSEDILNYGLRQASTISAHYIYTKERAVKVAEMLARKAKLERNTYTFKLDWAFCRLEPADIVTITDENIGVDHLPVRITSITEDAKGAIVCTAVEVDNVSGEVQYDVHDVDRPYVNFNIPAPDIDTPLIIQPPADLTSNGLEIWLGAKSSGEGWGGCTVYVSDDDLNYRTVGQINNSARIGELEQAMTDSDTSCVVSCNDVLLSGTEQDAERANTLIWIGGECLSYTTATLLQNGNYRLDGLVRGQYNTTASAHVVGEQFARLDSALLRQAFNKEDIGKTIYFKFASFNIFGAMEQDLSDVEAYTYVIQPYYVPPVVNLSARNRYRQLKDGVNRYDIVVEWDIPNLQSYLEGRVWYKNNNGQSKYITMTQGVKISELGFTGDWTFGGSGKTTVTIPQAVVGDTYRIAVTTVDVWGVETSPDFAPHVDIKVALKTEVPNTPDGFGIVFGESPVVSWKEVTNTDIAFYEVRLDPYAGVENASLLARVTGLTTILPLTSRTGKLYLFAYSASGKYSTPAILDYNKPAPPTPNAPTLTQKLGGFSIVFDAIPAGCIGANIYIDSNELVEIYTENNTHTFTCNAGIYDVSIAYVDMFGEGEHSLESRIVVKVLVDEALIEAQAISKAKLDTALQSAVDKANQSAIDIDAIQEDITELHQEDGRISATVADVADDVSDLDGEINNNTNGIKKRLTQVEVTASGLTTTVASQGTTLNNHTTQINQTSDAISAVVTNLNKQDPAQTGYTAITALSTGVASKVSMGDVTSYFQQTHDGFLIEGSLIRIKANNAQGTGGTVIDGNVIARDMIQANAIDATKISVSNLSSICATIGTLRTASTGARVEIKDNLIEVYDNNRLRVRIGVWT